MHAKDHLAKAARIEQTRTRKLDLDADYEMVIWSCIHGGAQLLNAALHAQGVTDEQFDMIHTDMPQLDKSLPPEVAEIMRLLESIERLGPRFVRGNQAWTREIAEECAATYGRIKKLVDRAQ